MNIQTKPNAFNGSIHNVHTALFYFPDLTIGCRIVLDDINTFNPIDKTFILTKLPAGRYLRRLQLIAAWSDFHLHVHILRGGLLPEEFELLRILRVDSLPFGLRFELIEYFLQ